MAVTAQGSPQRHRAYPMPIRTAQTGPTFGQGRFFLNAGLGRSSLSSAALLNFARYGRIGGLHPLIIVQGVELRLEFGDLVVERIRLRRFL